MVQDSICTKISGYSIQVVICHVMWARAHSTSRIRWGGKHHSYQEWWRQHYRTRLILLETGGLSFWRTGFHFLVWNSQLLYSKKACCHLQKEFVYRFELPFYFTVKAQHAFRKDKAKTRHFSMPILDEMQFKTCCCQASSSITFYLAPHLSWDAKGIHINRTY